MTEGSFFGEIGLLFSVPRTASCRCNGRCIVLVLLKEKFYASMSLSPKASRAITLMAEERFSHYVKAKQTIEFGEELTLCITSSDLNKVN